MSKVSMYGMSSVLIFLLLSLFGRLVFPFGDEPDWSYRVQNVLDVQGQNLWSPYLLFSDWLHSFNANSSNCLIDAGPMSFWGSIGSGCYENLGQVLIRFILTVFILTPLFYVVIFRKSFVRLMSALNYRLSYVEWDLRLNALSLSLLLPGMIYYLGVFAEEQFFLVIALFLFLFWGFWSLIIPLFVLLLATDFGNSIVVLSFILLMLVSKKVINKYDNRFYLLMILGLVLFAYIIGFSFLSYITSFESLLGPNELMSKANAMYLLLENGDLVNKYPVILRPVITFMSMVFMTPSGLKSILAYLFFSAFIVHFLTKRPQNHPQNHFKKISMLYLITPVTLVLIFVFLFPVYANAKYYMFIFPFLFYAMLLQINKKNMQYFLTMLSVIVLVNLFIYRL